MGSSLESFLAEVHISSYGSLVFVHEDSQFSFNPSIFNSSSTICMVYNTYKETTVTYNRLESLSDDFATSWITFTLQRFSFSWE